VIVEKPGFDFTLVIVLQNGALTARLGSADFLRFLLSKKKKGFKNKKTIKWPIHVICTTL